LVTTIRITRLRWAGHIVRMKIIYSVRKLHWISRKAEGDWEGQTSDGWME